MGHTQPPNLLLSIKFYLKTVNSFIYIRPLHIVLYMAFTYCITFTILEAMFSSGCVASEV